MNILENIMSLFGGSQGGDLTDILKIFNKPQNGENNTGTQGNSQNTLMSLLTPENIETFMPIIMNMLGNKKEETSTVIKKQENENKIPLSPISEIADRNITFALNRFISKKD